MSELGQSLAAAVLAADPQLSRSLDADPDAYLRLVSLTARAHEETRAMMAAAVRAARTAGHSWEAIGRLLGMTRQAAQQRFGEPAGGADDGLRRLAPVTAFTEMAALREAGAQGWHSVGYGAGYHLLTKSAQPWEHVRALVHSRRARQLTAAGWQRIGTSWYPWVYFKRPVAGSIKPGPAQYLSSGS